MIIVSVIIPTYKPQDYLWKCLQSLNKQTFPHSDFELILILNGDKEPYYSAIQGFINEVFDETCHVVCLYSEWGNVSNARNIGLEHAKGEYITFIDDDDFVSQTYLQELFNVSDLNTIGLSYPYAFNDGEVCQLKNYYITKEYDCCASRGLQDYLIPKKFFSGPCMKLIHRSIIDDRRFDTRFQNGEDSLFMFLISDRMKYVNFTSKDAIYYRRFRKYSATMSNKTFSDVLKNRLKLMLEYSKIYFSNRNNYRVCRYLVALLGSFHALLVEFPKSIKNK